MPLNVNVHKRSDGVFVVTPSGRLDSDTYFLFEEKIKPILVPATSVLIFDMAELDYISSAGLGVIFFAKKFMEEKNSTFIITNLKPQIKKVFDIVKVLPKTPLFRTMEEVDSYLDAIQKRELDKQGNPPQA